MSGLMRVKPGILSYALSVEIFFGHGLVLLRRSASCRMLGLVFVLGIRLLRLCLVLGGCVSVSVV